MISLDMEFIGTLQQSRLWQVRVEREIGDLSLDESTLSQDGYGVHTLHPKP